MTFLRDVYVVLLDGNRFIMSHKSVYPCIKECLNLALYSSVYVELWYYADSRHRKLLRSWN